MMKVAIDDLKTVGWGIDEFGRITLCMNGEEFFAVLADPDEMCKSLHDVLEERDEGIRRMMRSWWKSEDGK